MVSLAIRIGCLLLSILKLFMLTLSADLLAADLNYFFDFLD